MRAEEEKLSHNMQALGVDSLGKNEDDLHSPKNRAGSAPPNFDSSYLFLYQEDDVYTRSFSKGFTNMRKENSYNEFNEVNKHKHNKPNMPLPLFQEDYRSSKNSRGNSVNLFK